MKIIGEFLRALVDAVVAREILSRKDRLLDIEVEYVAYWPNGNVSITWGVRQ